MLLHCGAIQQATISWFITANWPYMLSHIWRQGLSLHRFWWKCHEYRGWPALQWSFFLSACNHLTHCVVFHLNFGSLQAGRMLSFVQHWKSKCKHACEGSYWIVDPNRVRPFISFTGQPWSLRGTSSIANTGAIPVAIHRVGQMNMWSMQSLSFSNFSHWHY